MNSVTLLAAMLLAFVYAWTFYNIPVLFVGIRKYKRETRERKTHTYSVQPKNLPTFSIIVPAKNEERVLPRLLEALLGQQYPKDKVEIIVVEDGSTDSTPKICKAYAKRSQDRINVFHARDSCGKASALNRALRIARGDILGYFDADSIPEKDTLSKTAGYFHDKSVAALQGRLLTANSDVNMLTKFVSYEESMWCEGYLKGKDAMNLFVHLRGSCQFIRRTTLERLGGWNESHLSEDMELSARLVEQGHRVKYASDVRTWQESPEGLTQMLNQRIRWFRGSMEVALKYGRLIRKPSFKTLDAEATLFGPFVLIISMLSYIISPLGLPQLGGSIVVAMTAVGWILLTATLISGALALMYVARPRKKRDLLWLPFIYAYWSLQVFLATWALLKILFRSSREWRKTPKTGHVNTAEANMPTPISYGSMLEASSSDSTGSLVE